MTIFGTDTSGSAKKAAALAAAGARFSYPRCISEASDGSIDPGFATMVGRDRAHGRISGGYDFLGKSIDGHSSVAAHHASLYVQAAGAFIEADRDFMVVIDLEHSQFRPNADWSDVVAWVKVFRTSFPGHPVGIYVGAFFAVAGEPANWASSIGPCYWLLPWYPARPGTTANIAALYASYGGDGAPQWGRTRGGQHPAVWQFAGTISVAGQNVDLNAYRGSADQFRGLVSGDPSVPAPAPAPVQPAAWYTVVSGDTLSGIASRHQTTLARLLALPENAGFRANPGLIFPGQKVRVA